MGDIFSSIVYLGCLTSGTIVKLICCLILSEIWLLILGLSVIVECHQIHQLSKINRKTVYMDTGQKSFRSALAPTLTAVTVMIFS